MRFSLKALDYRFNALGKNLPVVAMYARYSSPNFSMSFCSSLLASRRPAISDASKEAG